jgi:hypothetical protein
MKDTATHFMVCDIVFMDYLIAGSAEVPFMVILADYLIIYDFVAVNKLSTMCAIISKALIHTKHLPY